MRHISDTTHRGHEVCLFQADDGTYTVDIRQDTNDGPMIFGVHGLGSAQGALDFATAYIDGLPTLTEGVGTTTPEGRPLTAVTRFKCFTCNETKLRHYLTYEWIHARGDSLCDDVANPYPVTAPTSRDGGQA